MTTETTAWDTETATFEILRMAQIQADIAAASGAAMASSAKLTALDAERLYNSGEHRLSRERAIASLRYSQGVFGAEYIRAFDLLRHCD